ncbi:MAG: ATP-binding protein [Acidimicrobiales bacterium]
MPEVMQGFPPELECVGEARRFVTDALAGWGLDDAQPAASMLVTELATNSVLHARTGFRVALSFDGDLLRLGVSDGSTRAPREKAHSHQATTGRGIHLVAAYADSWGVEPAGDGKTVWCVLRARSSILSEPLAESAVAGGPAVSGVGKGRARSGRRAQHLERSPGCRWAA